MGINNIQILKIYYFSKLDRNVLKNQNYVIQVILYISTLMKDKEGLVLCKSIFVHSGIVHTKKGICAAFVYLASPKQTRKDGDLKSAGFKAYLRMCTCMYIQP